MAERSTVPMHPDQDQADEKPRKRVRKRRRKAEESAAVETTAAAESEPETTAQPGPTGQTYIPGCEPPRIPEVDRLALEYRATRDQRMELTRQEAEQKSALLDAMREHGLEEYPVPDTDQEVVLQHGEDTVKVRKRQGVEE